MADGKLDTRFTTKTILVQNHKKRSKGVCEMKDKDMMKSEVLNELSKLYILRQEGKKVDSLIARFEEALYRIIDDELDEKKADEKDKKDR
jgi:hypothetical protein